MSDLVVRARGYLAGEATSVDSLVDDLLRALEAATERWHNEADARANQQIRAETAEARAEAAERVVEAAREMYAPYEATWDSSLEVEPRIQTLLNAARVVYDTTRAYDKRQNPDKPQPIDRMGIKVDGVQLRDLPPRSAK